MEIARDIRKGGDSIVNWYAVEQGGKVTLVDTGLRRQWGQLAGLLAAMGRAPADVEAVLLTHAHVDHVGFAETARSELGVTVRGHSLDVPVAEGRQGEQRVTISQLPLWKPATWKFLYVMIRGGATAYPAIGEVVPVADGDVLDVPGRPRVMHTPGHTPGSASYHFPDHEALFTGDTLVTMALTGGPEGPQILPDEFHADPRAVRDSVSSLGSVEASLVLPGHGPAFRGSPADALERLG